MIGWMVYPKIVLDNPYGNNAFEWMIDSAQKYGIDLRIVFKEDLIIEGDKDVCIKIKGELVETPDMIIMRCYHYQLNKVFELMGIRVINTTEAMFNTKDKGITSTILKFKGVDTPNYILNQRVNYQQVQDHFSSNEFIVKSLDGSGGEGIYLVKNEPEFEIAIDKIYGEFMCQEYVDTSFGRDIRLYVLGDQVIGGVLRQASHDFRSNFALGGHAKAIEITEEMKALALKGCKALGVEFAGVDLLFTKEGYTICEINGNAGFRTLSQVTNVDMGDELFRYVRNTTL